MTASISTALIAQLKPTLKQYDVRDKKLKGFLIRVQPSGTMSYVCEYKRGKRINLGPVNVLTLAQARDMAKKTIGDAVQGIDPLAAKRPPKTITLQSFINEKYKPWAEAHRKAGIDAVDRIKRCFYDSFGNQPLHTLTPFSIDQWRTNKLKSGRTTQTINRDVATLKAAISKAVEWDIIETHPLSKLKLFKVDSSSKIRYLDSNEESQLRLALQGREQRIIHHRTSANEWRSARHYDLKPTLLSDHFADYLQPMFLISINTGVRQGELFSLNWENVDFRNRILTIAGDLAKSGKTRHIPLNKEALTTLEKWHAQSERQGLVFPSKKTKKFNNIHKSWQNILTQAEIKNFRWHDLRHHFASRLVMAGVDLNTVRELLGHSDIKMTLRYAHLAPEHKAAAVAKLDSHRLPGD